MNLYSRPDPKPSDPITSTQASTEAPSPITSEKDNKKKKSTKKEKRVRSRPYGSLGGQKRVQSHLFRIPRPDLTCLHRKEQIQRIQLEQIQLDNRHTKLNQIHHGCLKECQLMIFSLPWGFITPGMLCVHEVPWHLVPYMSFKSFHMIEALLHTFANVSDPYSGYPLTGTAIIPPSYPFFTLATHFFTMATPLPAATPWPFTLATFSNCTFSPSCLATLVSFCPQTWIQLQI